MTIPADGEQQQGGEHSGNVETVAGLRYSIGQPGTRAGGAGRDLGDHMSEARCDR